MKKFTRTGKKALSVFLAALMVMTAWVFVAPEAQAQSAGSYYVTITFNVDNHDDESFGTYTGKSQNGNNTVGISLFYKANNGTASTASEKVFDLGSYVGNNAAQTSHTLTCTVAGFPSEVYGYVNDDNIADKTAIRITKVQCGSSSSNLKTIWSGNARIESVKNPYYCTLTPTSSTANANDSATYVKDVDASGWVTPAPTTITWSPATLSAMTCPKTGTTATQTVKVTAKDQYGVNMYDPMWSVSGSKCGTTGISMSTQNDRDESSTIQLTNAANIAGTTDTQTGTVTATWGSGQTKSKTFTINDTTYTATFTGLKDDDGNDKDNVTAEYQHGHVPTAAKTASKYSIGDYDFNFSGWDNDITKQIESDITYRAQYTRNFVGADLTELNKQIANADYIKTTDLWTTGSYTDESRAALESALESANKTKNNNPGRTMQGTVDSVAKNLKDAIDALKLKTYTVNFYNAEGLIIKTEEVVAGKAATAPASPSKNDDETYHYSFQAWDKDFSNVTSNLDVKPTYTSEAHKWQTSVTVPANCLHGAGIKKTCSVCSRVSESYDDTLGAHTKSTHYAVSKEATCTTDGTGYYYCTVCGTKMGDVTIKAKGHTYDKGTVTQDATCTATGTRLHTCTTCGDKYTETLEKIPHTYVKDSTVVATCKHSAYDVMKCSVCGDTYNKYVGGIADHDWEWTIKNATSVSSGSVTGKCKNCGYTFTKEVPFDGHNYDFDNPVITDPTCVKAGSVVIGCKDSGCNEKITIALKATGIHNYTTKYNAPTCTATGSIVNTCSVCNTSTTVETIAALGHNYGEAVVTAATCTTDGKMVYICARCNDVKTVTIPATGHKEYVIDAIEATCNTEGRTEGKKCAVCGEIIVSSTVIAKKAHSFTGEIKTIAATCEADGATLTKCANCDAWKIEPIAKTGHNYKDEVVKSTCTSKGYTKHTCENCGKVYTDNETAMIAHNYVLDTNLSLAPSCEGEGVNIYVCSVCGSSKSEKVKAKGHSFGAWSEYIPATCTNKGVEIRSCSVCGKIEKNDLPALGHVYSDNYTVDIPATCTTAGSQSKHCTRDGCDARTNVESIDALGHNYQLKSKTDATCKEAGVEEYECSRCHDVNTTVTQPKEHKYNQVKIVAPTCGSAGYTIYKCESGCDFTYKDNFEPATGKHQWSISQNDSHGETVVNGICKVCEQTFTATVKSGHKFTQYVETKVADCKTEGIITVKCEEAGCNESYEIKIGKGGHTGIKTTVTNPTCKAAGKVTTVCETCGATIYAEQEIPMNNHDWKVTITKKATCTEKGELTYKCDCGATKTEEIEVDPNAHEFVAGTSHAADCKTPAYTEYTCKHCDESYKDFTGEVAAHDWTTSIEQNGTILTITCTCTKCGSKHTEEKEVFAGHTYKRAEEVETATCTKPGKIRIYCTDDDCNAYVEAEVPVNLNAHNIEMRYAAPSCNSEGTIYNYCTICGKQIGETVTLAALGHIWDEGKVTNPATCTKDGEKTFTCTRNCGETRTESIPKLGHDWGNGTPHDADCTHGAYNHYECQRDGCDETYDVVPNGAEALGHDWNSGEVTKTATCTTDGEMTYTCKKCTVTRTEVIPKLGHDYQQGTKHNATCSSSAYTEMVCKNDSSHKYNLYEGGDLPDHNWSDWKVVTEATNTTKGEMERTCSVCGKKETAPIPAGDHEFDMDNPTVVTPATCHSEGKTTYKCKHDGCGVEITVTTEKIPHTFTTEVTPATCIKEGEVKTYCTNNGCGEEILTELPLVQHTYDNGVVTSATCTERAYTTYTCKVCKDIKVVFDETSKPTGHEYKFSESTATCTTPGTITVTCAKCEDVKTEVSVPALGHKYEVKETVAATCHSVGYTVYKCSRCDDEQTVYSDVMPEHDWSAWTVTKAPDEKTGTAGEQERHCQNDGCTATETALIPASIHNWVEDETLATAATCYAAATKTYYCEGCDLCKNEDMKQNATYTETVGNPRQHEINVDYQAPTCTESGHNIVTCVLCNTVFKNEVLAEIDHSFTERVSYNPATCVSNGSITYRCKNCDATTEIEIDFNPNAHNMDNGTVVAPTCTIAGYTEYKCQNQGCNYSYMKDIKNPTNHIGEIEDVVTPATCSSIGYKVIKCKCGAIVKTEIIPVNENAHKWETKSQEATCKQGGYSYKQCSECGKMKDFTSTVPEKHDYVIVEKVDATATTDGYVKSKCSKCGDEITVTIPRSGCNFVEDEDQSVAPTCTEKGKKVYVCTLHHESYTDEIAALGHDAGEAKFEQATCIKAGSVTVKCKRDGCGETIQEIIVPALAHTFNETKVTVKAATCKEEGSKTYTCTTDGCGATLVVSIPKAQHNYVFKETHAATCLDSEYQTYECSVCGEASYNVVTKSANGHKYELVAEKSTPAECGKPGHAYYECVNCTGDEKAHYEYDTPATGNHSFTKEVKKDATCTEAGYTYNVCESCGAVDEKSIKAIDPLGHDYSVDNGDGTLKCSRCDSKINYSTEKTDENGNKHYFIGTITKQSTCKEQGEQTFVCQTHENCSENYTETLPLAGHSVTAESITRTEGNCKTQTKGKIVIKCSVCGDEIQTIELDYSHNFKVVKVERPNCASEGTVTERCEICGEEKTTTIAINAGEHTFSATPELVIEPTCTTDGYKIYKCTHCDARRYEKYQAATGHSSTRIEKVEATCEADGYEIKICNTCETIIEKKTLEKLGHIEEVKTVEPTCTKGGTITKKCSRCGKLLEDIVYTPAKGHRWGEWYSIKDGSCNVEGEEERKCLECGATERRGSGFGNHVFEKKNDVVTPATCTEDGYTTHYCSNCGYSYVDSYTPKTGHVFEGEYKVLREPTCHSTGIKAPTCIYCHDFSTYKDTYISIPAKNHTYGEWEIVKKPTCEENGLKRRTCTGDGCTDADDGHTQEEVIARNGHHYGDWEITKNATCISEGEHKRVCDSCGYVDVEPMAKTGHTRVADYGYEATCTSTGLTNGSHCSVCGYVFVAQEVIPKGRHMDLSGDGRCDTCGAETSGTDGKDTCLCHKTGFAAFIYSFVKFFWKLFKINETCVCGAKHY